MNGFSQSPEARIRAQPFAGGLDHRVLQLGAQFGPHVGPIAFAMESLPFINGLGGIEDTLRQRPNRRHKQGDAGTPEPYVGMRCLRVAQRGHFHACHT